MPKQLSLQWWSNLASALGGRERWLRTLGREVPAPSPLESYVRTVFQALAVFRFVSFAMGAGLIFALNPGPDPSAPLVLVVIFVGLYNAARVAWRFDPIKHRTIPRNAIIGVDVLLAVLVVVITDALDSGFLIYSLSPILTASLLMDVRTSGAVAGLTALSITGVHLAAGLGVGDFPKLLSGNYLAFAVLYTAICLLIAYLPFLANLNWQRRVRSESLAAERNRLRREVHDNVAQTLAFLSLKMRRAEERASEPRDSLTRRDISDIGSAVERAYLAVRDYMDGTEATEAEATTLEAALTDAVSQWSRDTGLKVNMSSRGQEGTVPSGIKFQLVQVAREALANVAKHAMSTQVWVELNYTSHDITLKVRDNGRGFVATDPRGHGMDIMRERTGMINASLDIQSAPGRGTEVVVAYHGNGGE